MNKDKARADRWRAFWNEAGGLKEGLEGLKRAYFERAATLNVKDTDGLMKLSMASKIVEELERHVANIIATGDLIDSQAEHLARIQKVGRRW